MIHEPQRWRKGLASKLLSDLTALLLLKAYLSYLASSNTDIKRIHSQFSVNGALRRAGRESALARPDFQPTPQVTGDEFENEKEKEIGGCTRQL